MGSITFLLPDPVPAAADHTLRLACFAGGYDQTPVPTCACVADGRLVVAQETDESGYLLVPWPVEGFGTVVTTTATLRQRPEPYSLLVELARGKLNQVRTQLAEWQGLGLVTPDDFDAALTEATRLFGRAALNQPVVVTDPTTDPAVAAASAESDAAAARVLRACYDLADRLVSLYVEQVFATRHTEEGRVGARLAARVARPPVGGLASEYRRAFNAVHIGLRWRDVEPVESEYDWDAVDRLIGMAKSAGLPVTIGPVIDLSPGMLPDWAAGWDGDLPTLAAFMSDFLETVIARYRADVRRWVVCAGFNHADVLGLSDDDRLRLAARLFDAAAQLDPELDLLLGLAQPWGDYLAGEDQTISPLAFADDLVRAGLRVTGLELEFRPGLVPRGSLPRDLLDACRVIDLFGRLLGMPLDVVLSYPADGGGYDPLAEDHQQALWPGDWSPRPSPDGQAQWGAAMAALALCKPHVRAVTWDHWSDADPHLTPSGGLVDVRGNIRPLLTRLRDLRTEHLE